MEGFPPRVEFCALGPVGVIVEGRPITLGSPKLRTVLAALLVDANSVISTDRLVDILWGDDPPASARATLQKLVYRLRLMVEPDRSADHLVVTRAPGYVLRVGPQEYDASRFEDLLHHGRARAAEGAMGPALASLDEALGLWRGPAFAEFAYDDFARAEAARLEELRITALEDRVDAKLTLGLHEEVVGELERTVDAYPLRERSRGQLMLALYRAGRQVEALRAYQHHRRYLIDELGIEPSASLRALEAAMLVQAPELDYRGPPIAQARSSRGANDATAFPPPSVPVGLAEAETARAFGDRIARAATTRIDLDLLEDEIADTVLDLHRRHGESGSEAPDDGGSNRFARCPYKGLASFASTDADYFFGRERLVAELVARVAVDRFVGVVGVSGSGKSSLLLAGICPALRAGALPGSERWRTVVMTPGAAPMERLARALAGGVPGLLLDLARARLHDDPDALERIADEATTGAAPDARLVVVVDQFEELFTMCRDDEERSRFVEVLSRPSADPRASVSVIVSIRADYYARCAALPQMAPLLGTTVAVGTMTGRELRRAIEGPARRADLRLEDGLTDLVVADVAEEPGGLPLLSTALLETWVRRDHATLTVAGYEDAGGVSGALSQLAESVYQRFDADEQLACRRILLRLAEPAEADDDVRRRAPLAELVAPADVDAATVLATLIDQRLVTAGADGVEVAHEALLREWPRARTWLEDDREGRRLHHHLAVSAAEWEATDRDPAELYRGARLAAAVDWSSAHLGEANPVEREFLETASAAHDAELRSVRTSARRLRTLLVAAAVLLVVALAAGTLALVQRSDARDRARAAELNRLATQAATLGTEELGRALLLGVEAHRLDGSGTGDGALQTALAHAPAGLERMIRVRGGFGFADLRPDGRRLVTLGGDGKARIVAVPSGRVVRTLAVDPRVPAATARFSPDGRLVVVTSFFEPDGTVRVFDARTGRPTGPELQAGTGFAVAQFVSDDPLRLVTATADQVDEWDLSDPTHPRRVGAPLIVSDDPAPQSVTMLAISPDGRTVATSVASIDDIGPGGSTNVLDLASGARLLDSLTGRPVAFTPDGTQLVLRRAEEIAFVDVVTGADQRVVALGFAPGAGVALSADARRLAVADDGTGAVHVFDAATGEAIGQPFTLFNAANTTLAFLSDDRLLGGTRTKAAVWRYRDATSVFATLLPGHTGFASAQFTPDGSEIVTTDQADHRVRRFRARDGHPLGPELPAAVPTAQVAISPDGSTAAVPEADGTVSLWDRRTGVRQARVDTGLMSASSGPFPIAVAWSPVGSVLATVSASDPAIVLWDVSDRRRPAELHRIVAGEPVSFPARSVTFSPDGRVAAVNDYPRLGHVTFVEVARGRLRRSGPLGSQIGPLVYSPDGRTIATMRYTGGSLLLLDAMTGRIRAARPVPGWPRSWGFVQGGRLIATGSVPGVGNRGRGPTTLELWDATTLEPFGAPVEITDGGALIGGANPDGTKLVSNSDDGAAVLWDLDPRDWERLACRIAGRNLTRTEWDQYLPGREYHRTCPS